MPFVPARPGQEAQLMARASSEPLFNLFLISNLMQGIGPTLDVWASDTGGLLMHRRGRWTVWAGPEPARFDFAGAAAIMDQLPPNSVQMLVGRPDAVDPICSALQHHRGVIYEQFFAAMSEPPGLLHYNATVRQASLSDLDRLADLYANAGDLSRPRSAVAHMIPTAWVAERDGDIVTAGYVSGETDQAAMVGGIFTPPYHRQRGYATALVHAMSTWLLKRGKTPCLFYHNPDAGRIYLRLGYRQLGPWRMVKF